MQKQNDRVINEYRHFFFDPKHEETWMYEVKYTKSFHAELELLEMCEDDPELLEQYTHTQHFQNGIRKKDVVIPVHDMLEQLKLDKRYGNVTKLRH